MARATTTKTTAKTAPAAKKEPKQKDEFAVILSGGKQYVVSVGDIVDVELLPKEYKEGDVVEFDTVLLVDNGADATIGTPYIDGAKVKAIYQGEKKGKKLQIVRYMAKSNRDRKIGHRQHYSRVKIESLV
ncbi:50S ribosomal protein L21 [Candidatus Kaiserbacteria bacterium]|nr:50S ribosomal protein L21 [Candidatus Kaiserbacteria bacterium]